jgi:hypothetical protein
MSFDLLAPWNLLCVLGLVPVAAAGAIVRRRQVAAARELGLARPRGALGWPLLLASAAALVAVAAAQPALVSSHAVTVRTDAEAYVVVDTSISMLARPARRDPARIDDARRVTLELAELLPPSLRVGIAVMPQGVLPALAPTTNRALLRRVVDGTVGVGSLAAKPQDQLLTASGTAPTPSRANAPYVATNLTALKSLVVAPFFRRETTRRLAVLITDAESSSFPLAPVVSALRRSRVQLLVVRVGSARDRLWRQIHGRVALDRGYAPAVASYDEVDALARRFGSGVYRPAQVGALDARVRQLLGSGPEAVSRRVIDPHPVGPYLALAALVLAAIPLAHVLPALPSFSRGRVRRLAPGRRRSRPSARLSPP